MRKSFDRPAKKCFVPVTPGGTPCTWLASKTEAQAWINLLEDAKHMPYKDIAGFQARGYTMEQYPMWVLTQQAGANP